MKLGMLIKVGECSEPALCPCFFCSDNSNRVGLVSGMSERGWYVNFDVGQYELFDNDFQYGLVEVLNESR